MRNQQHRHTYYNFDRSKPQQSFNHPPSFQHFTGHTNPYFGSQQYFQPNPPPNSSANQTSGRTANRHKNNRRRNNKNKATNRTTIHINGMSIKTKESKKIKNRDPQQCTRANLERALTDGDFFYLFTMLQNTNVLNVQQAFNQLFAKDKKCLTSAQSSHRLALVLFTARNEASEAAFTFALYLALPARDTFLKEVEKTANQHNFKKDVLQQYRAEHLTKLSDHESELQSLKEKIQQLKAENSSLKDKVVITQKENKNLKKELDQVYKLLVNAVLYLGNSFKTFGTSASATFEKHKGNIASFFPNVNTFKIASLLGIDGDNENDQPRPEHKY